MDAETKQNETKSFKWNGKKQEAARLVAEDSLTESRIAAKVGIKRVQLWRWKKAPEFAARVKEIVNELGERSLKYAVARRHRRVKAADDRWRKLKQVIRDRAADPRMADIPGGKTGLIVIEESEVVMEDAREGDVVLKKARAVPTEVAVDTGTLKALLDIEKQVAQEVGQWTEKRELTGPDGAALPIMVIEVVRTAPPAKEGDEGA